MEAQGVTTLSEALRNVPGISLQAGEGGGASNTSGDMFNLRGFSANNSLFVDGVRDDGLVSRDVYNLEQVEVFLGPAGTDVGRGTAAGYVNMTTKTPAVQTRYSGAATFGTADQRRVSVDVNQATPFGETGSWWRGTAVRLNGLVQDSGVSGRDEVRLRTQAIAPSLALGLGTHVRVVRRRPVPAPGQPARLRHPRRGVAGRPARPRRRGRPEPGRPVELLRHAGQRLRRRLAGQRVRQGRVRHPADGAAAVAAPLQPGAPHRGDLHDPEPGGLQPRHRARDDRAPGQRARERHHLEPDQRVDRRRARDGRRTRSSARSSSRTSRSSRRRSAASARGRPRTSTRPT